MLRSFVLSLSLSFLATAVFGQDKMQGKKPFVLGVIDQVRSNVLSETRILNVYLPDGYDKDTAHYPVIYLLDGSADEDFIHIVGLEQFLNMIQVMPKSIIIGIANVDRKRDFTFPTKIDSDRIAYPTTGHSDKFISFIEKDLQPYVQQHYRTTASKTIIGQSLGGLLATEILFKAPALFNNYVIVSPSLWWDNESIMVKAPLYIKAFPNNRMNVYIAVGSEGKQMENDAATLADQLKQFGSKDLRVYYSFMPAENHLTILHNAVYNAIEWLNAKQ